MCLPFTAIESSLGFIYQRVCVCLGCVIVGVILALWDYCFVKSVYGLYYLTNKVLDEGKRGGECLLTVLWMV